MTVWIDVDNPPQVQYLVPFRRAFQEAGEEVVVTARDYGPTARMLDEAGVPHTLFGRQVGRSRVRKVAALAERSRALRRHFAGRRPRALLCASRPSAVAARQMGIPSFVIGDYEYANVLVYRFTRSVILHPRVIDAEVFVRRGMPRDRLIAFDGIKEDITFHDVDTAAVVPHEFHAPPGVPRVLFRPPSETSHYYDEASSSMARAALERLAALGALVVLSPRDPSQRAMLDGVRWPVEPIVLDRPLPFVALLKGVDAVVCSGGTMLREAAYLGIPAYSILRSEIGAVDRWLEDIGRATLIAGPDDLDRLTPRRAAPLPRLDANPSLLEEIAEIVLTHRAGAPRPLATAAAGT